MSATSIYRIVGFCDVKDKQHGRDDIVWFRDPDCFTADALPSQIELRQYASAHGYPPSGGRGCDPEQCQPVYYFHGETEHRVRHWPEEGR